MPQARRVRRLCAVLLIVVAVPLATPDALAQTRSTTGIVAGAVLDPDGKAVVGAPVMARNKTSGETRTTTTDGAGHFSIASLTPGSYAIEVFVPGFDTVHRTGVQLTGGNTEELAIRLNVANIRVTYDGIPLTTPTIRHTTRGCSFRRRRSARPCSTAARDRLRRSALRPSAGRSTCCRDR